RASSSIRADRSIPRVSRAFSVVWRSPVSLPVPQPRSTTRMSSAGRMRASRSKNGCSRSPRNLSYCVGFQVSRCMTSDFKLQLSLSIRFALQVVHADSEQPDWPPAGLRLVDELHRPRDNVALVASGVARMAARDRGEVGIAYLDRHGPRQQLPLGQPPRLTGGHRAD